MEGSDREGLWWEPGIQWESTHHRCPDLGTTDANISLQSKGEKGQEAAQPWTLPGRLLQQMRPSEEGMMASLEDKPTFRILPNLCSGQPSSSHINIRGIRKPCIHLTLLLLICSLPASTFALIFIKHHTREIQISLCGTWTLTEWLLEVLHCLRSLGSTRRLADSSRGSWSPGCNTHSSISSSCSLGLPKQRSNELLLLQHRAAL